MLPQIASRRKFDYVEGVKGLRLILWGMFKKVVVADTCAVFVNDIFGNVQDHSGPTLMLGAICFAFRSMGTFRDTATLQLGQLDCLAFG